ncbi:MAG: tRNA preQ1(34) S-adenosylmethionine ribosyltransferase-isomerase QueA [Deltaproteobacteria bacterium]|nr:tRNA preQ1(34) S-adenosylmethionine ribosyltransferase-isomerase QueA [Deltaproteobacteria bacterium]
MHEWSPSDFDYHLPRERIAQDPSVPRDASRLLVVQRGGAPPQSDFFDQRAYEDETAFVDAVFSDLVAYLPESCLLVFNDTKVFPARLWARRRSGGRIEVLLVRRQDREEGGDQEGWTEHWEAYCRPARRLKPGEFLELEDPIQGRDGLKSRDGLKTSGEINGKNHAGGNDGEEPGRRSQDSDGVGASAAVTLVGRLEGGRMLLRFSSRRPGNVVSLCRSLGSTPLPPYISRPEGDRPEDRQRYQTVYAKNVGAVAAPTAGLHFTPGLLARMKDAGHEFAWVTLHVGPGTFRPVKVDRLDDHVMHSEWYDLPEQTVAAIEQAKREGRTVVAVGTTSVRVLESCAAPDGSLEPGMGQTALFIRPGYRFRVVDAMITNFHLPRSTLLMLVSAFSGLGRILAAYRHAVEERYRFYSYGDAMLLL